jgi:hypothetical protein
MSSQAAGSEGKSLRRNTTALDVPPRMNTALMRFCVMRFLRETAIEDGIGFA